MGSILNFVFPFDKDNMPDWFIIGPLYSAISVNCNHTHNFELVEGCENILVCETVEKFKGFIRNFTNKIGDKTLEDFIYKNPNIKIILSSIADPCGFWERKEITQFISEKKLDDRTYFVESNFQNKNLKNTFCWHFFIEDASINIHRIFENEPNELGYISKKIELEETNNFRRKKFLCFNRTIDKRHRLSLLYDYLNSDFSDSYFSFLSYESNYENIFHDVEKEFDYNLYFKKFIPIELDTQNLKEKNTFVTGNAIGKKEFYLNSCINLVTETSFESNELFLSEKILKPIFNFQPFIVFGPVNYLKEMKRLGFKTFSDFWDESYDEIEDVKLRYFKIMEVVFNLNSKPIEEINEIYQKSKNICIHNHNHFMNFKYSFGDFIEFISEKK